MTATGAPPRFVPLDRCGICLLPFEDGQYVEMHPQTSKSGERLVVRAHPSCAGNVRAVRSTGKPRVAPLGDLQREKEEEA